MVRAPTSMVASPSLHIMQDTVNLSYRGLTCRHLVELAKEFQLDREITTLKLGFNELRDDGAKFIANLIKTNMSLTCLDLGFCSIGDEGVEALASGLISNHSLKILYLSGNLLTSVGFRYLGNALPANKGLSSLYLTGNAGQSEGAHYISEGLRYNRTIERLFINGNKIEKEGASSISDMLSLNHALTHLNMSDNNIGDEGMHSLSEAMHHQKNIKRLELSFNKITAFGITAFMESLIDYRGLKQLLLDNNKLECQGAKTLALALPHMELEDLNLGFNGIKWDGMLGIINSSSASRTLRSLTLSGNAIDDNVSVALANMLAVNTVLSALYLDHTGLSPHAEKMIANGIARNKHLALQVLTGMDLGKALVQLGSPIECAAMSNDQSLRYLVQVWAHHEHQQHVDSQQFSRCVEDKPQSPAAESSAQAASIASSQSNATMSSCNGSGSQTPVDSLISSDQSRKDVIDNLRSVVNTARNKRNEPFDTHELWELYNYFFKQPQISSKSISSESDVSEESDGGGAGSTSHHRPHDESVEGRPKKRPVNRHTAAHIAFYPLVKMQIDAYKSLRDEKHLLTLLRQLRYLEKALPDWEPPVLEHVLLQEVHPFAASQ